MVIARVLWGFDITWPVDENGQKIKQDIMKMVYGFMSTPEEFQATFKVRSGKHARIFRQEWAGLPRQTSLTNYQLNRRKESNLFISSIRLLHSSELSSFNFKDYELFMHAYFFLLASIFFIPSTTSFSFHIFFVLSLAAIASCHSLTSLIFCNSPYNSSP
jgi:hypothetical protein